MDAKKAKEAEFAKKKLEDLSKAKAKEVSDKIIKEKLLK